MRDYFTIIHDYFNDYFTDNIYFILRLFYDYTSTLLFYRLYGEVYAIISRRQHPENGNVLTAILHPIMEEWFVSVYEECLHICIDWKASRLGQAGKLPDGAFGCCVLALLYAFFIIICIICLGWTRLWALQVRPSHCTSMHTNSECNNKLMEHRGSCCCCRKCPNCNDYTRLF